MYKINSKLDLKGLLGLIDSVAGFNSKLIESKFDLSAQFK